MKESFNEWRGGGVRSFPLVLGGDCTKNVLLVTELTNPLVEGFPFGASLLTMYGIM